MSERKRCKKNRAPAEQPAAACLYVHVPLCRAKCRYCDFYSRPFEPAPADAFLSAVRAEIDLRRHCLRAPLDSIFIGGGTPTVLGAGRLDELLSSLAPLADERTEFTVEANPESLTAEVAAVLVGRGANRLSIGAQSLDDSELQLLGRPHGPDDVRRAVAIARDAGIANVSLDLIYAIPGQHLASWRRTLAEALSLAPQHLSCYALSVEAGTPMEADLRAGRIREVDESLQRACYEAAIEAAEAAGMEHYEISNFALPGRLCRHNLQYWHNRSYVGVGPAAASYLAGERRTNRPDLAAYVRSVSTGQLPPADSERLTGRAAMAETLMLNLRLIEGVDRREFGRRFGRDCLEAFAAELGPHLSSGLVEATDTHVRIARAGLFVSDSILADLFAAA